MKSAEEIMNILEAYDLTGSLRDAAELAGCSHHTVARYVAERERGRALPGGGHEICPTRSDVPLLVPGGGVPSRFWLSGANPYSASSREGTSEVCRGDHEHSRGL